MSTFMDHIHRDTAPWLRVECDPAPAGNTRPGERGSHTPGVDVAASEREHVVVLESEAPEVRL